MTTVESLQFDLETIEAATIKFSDDNKVGEGGFGQVFKVQIHEFKFNFRLNSKNIIYIPIGDHKIHF